MKRSLVVLGLVACSHPPPQQCPPSAPPVAAIPAATPASDAAESRDRLTRACGIAQILLGDHVSRSQLLAYDVSRASRMTSLLGDPKRLHAELDDVMRSVQGGRFHWAVTAPNKAPIALQTQPPAALLTPRVIGDGTSGTHALVMHDGEPVLAIGVPVVGASAWATLVLWHPLDRPYLSQLQYGARADITFATQLDGWSADCQPVGDKAAFRIGEVYVVVTNAR